MDLQIIVFSMYFLAIIGLTFYGTRSMRKTATEDFSDEFFVGGRKMGPFALAVLIAAGACSTGTFVGTPSMGALYGPGYVILFTFGQIMMNLYILSFLGKKINIVGRRTKSESYIDIFRHRYENWKPLIFIVVAAIMVALLSAAVAEFTGGSRVIQVMTGIPFSFSLIVFGVIITLYTALGGLKGVGIVGILQGIIMTVAAIILIVGYLGHYGGITPIFDNLKDLDPRLLTPNFGGEFSLIEMFGLWITYGVAVIGLPWAVQSTLSYDSTKTMKYAIMIGIVFVAFWTIFIGGWGGPASRLFSPEIAVADFRLPEMAQGILPGALSGIVLAGIAGAGQSTIAALLILASGSIVVNLYKAYINPHASNEKVKRISVIVTMAIGLLTILLALNPPNTLQILITFSIGAASGSLIAPLVLGLFWPRTNKYGAFAGVCGGLFFYIIFNQVNLGVPLLQEITLIFALPLSFALTIIVSLLTKKPTKETVQVYFGQE